MKSDQPESIRIFVLFGLARLTVSIFAASYCLTSIPAWAQSSPQSLPEQVTPDLEASTSAGTSPWGEERPGRQTSGDSRGEECIAGSEPELTALVPVPNRSPSSLGPQLTNMGSTTQARPTLWFHITNVSGDPIDSYFVLQDASGNNVIDVINFETPVQTGYFSVSLPPSFSLTPEIEYQWALELACESLALPVLVNGWIQRVALTPDLESQLTRSDRDSYSAYTNHSVWYDAISALAARRLSSPNNAQLVNDWSELLIRGGGRLNQLPSGPFLGEIEARSSASESEN